jgi:hypothetical protein
MEPLNPKLEELGRVVAEVSDREADPARTLAAARSRLFYAPRPRAASFRYALAAAAVVMVVLVVALGLGRVRRGLEPDSAVALSFVIDADERAGAVGEWISADDERVELRFSEGSRLAVEPHSRARVAKLTPHGAEVVVEQGDLDARITPGTATAWALRAGPFRVAVTGTQFDLRWDAAEQRFELTVREGSVKVVGPHLPADRSVVAGERLVVSVPEGRTELASGPAKRAPVPAVSVARPVQAAPLPADPAPGAPARARRDDSPSAASEGQPWREHLQAGHHREALAAAERQGFASVLNTASQKELWQLVDAARFGGEPARAVTVLQALRARGVRGNTAFMLGKIAADQQGAPSQAVTWFQTYLREAPHGALAEEALGRLMQLQRRSNPVAAAAVAKRYLARYPKGAYADLAKSLESR